VAVELPLAWLDLAGGGSGAPHLAPKGAPASAELRPAGPADGSAAGGRAAGDAADDPAVELEVGVGGDASWSGSAITFPPCDRVALESRVRRPGDEEVL